MRRVLPGLLTVLLLVSISRAEPEGDFDAADHRRLFAVRDTNAARGKIDEARRALANGDDLRGLYAAQEVLDEMARVPTDANDIPTTRTEVYDLRLVRPDAVVAATKKVERKSQPKIDPDAGPMKRFIQRVW